jgi:hypothetical protein
MASVLLEIAQAQAAAPAVTFHIGAAKYMIPATKEDKHKV